MSILQDVSELAFRLLQQIERREMILDTEDRIEIEVYILRPIGGLGDIQYNEEPGIESG